MNTTQGAMRFLRFASSLALIMASANAVADTPVSGNITANTTWTTANSPYIVTGTVSVGGGASPILTIQPGVSVKFNAGTALSVGSGSPGNLSAVGTSGQPITFTANTASPSPGYWVGIQIGSSATSATVLTWATVRYAGSTGFGGSGGVRLQGPAVTLTNVTSQNHLFAGVSVESGSPILKTCTLSLNPWGVYIVGGSPTLNTSTSASSNTVGGVYIAAPGTASLQTVTVSNNTGYAISQSARTTLGTVTSLTTTGNTNNAIELRSDGTIDVNTTWKKVGLPLPYVAGIGIGVQKTGAVTPVLTIQAGVTVKFVQNAGLGIGGGNAAGLQANGTAALPIIFTANTASPTPGYWSGVQFGGFTTSTSKISYATISYGGSGIYTQGSSPAIENVTLQNNSVAGISTFASTPKILNCSFSGNASGLSNQTPTTLVTAGLNYWNAASGPSGSGPGTGQSVSTGVVYEPWLIAAPTTPNYLNTALHTNRTFNPAISINTKVASGSAQSASWTTTILNGGGATVRTFTGTGTTWNSIWDGKNGLGVDQPDGTYTYQIQTGTATAAKGLTIVDRTKQLTLSNLATAPAYFSPNGDAIQDTALTTCSFNFDDVAWTLNVKNSGGTTVRTVTGTGPSISFAWDGKNTGGTIQPDGPYTMAVLGIDGIASVNGTSGATLDRTLPTATITSPTGGTTISNVYQNGVSDINVVGTASDTNMDHWWLNNVGWGVVAQGTTNVSNATIATWATLPLQNLTFTLEVKVWDKAGNIRTTSVQYPVKNFKISQNTFEFNGGGGSTVTYSSIVPFTLTETLYVKNAAGQTVRTIVNGASRTAATYNDTWNGRNGSSVLQPDGPYFYVATATAGASSMTWDLTNQFWNDNFGGGATLGSTFDPFSNQPLSLSYNIPFTGRLSIGFAQDKDQPSTCPPPNSCPVFDVYTKSGAGTYYWAGTDTSGKFRNDFKFFTVVMNRERFSKNAVVLYGTKPSVTAVTVTPPIYGPASGTQTVSYTLATYQSQNAAVTVTFLNQESLSVLRTITVPSVVPGARTLIWDGRADNGMLVAPGYYTVTVTTTDSIGNQASGQILTTVQY